MKYKQAVGHHLLHTIIHNIVRGGLDYYRKTTEGNYYIINKDITIENLYKLWTVQNIYMKEENNEGK